MMMDLLTDVARDVVGYHRFLLLLLLELTFDRQLVAACGVTLLEP